MRFSSHLSSHLTPEWKKHYIDYDSLKKMVYSIIDQVPVEEPDDGEGPGKCTSVGKVVARWRELNSLLLIIGSKIRAMKES